MAAPKCSTPPLMDEQNPQTDLLNALSALRVTGRYSDLTITCNYRQWAVHKAIICSRSAFFDGACSSPFLEATSGVIDLSEDDEDAVEQMIQFFYHLDYLKQSEEDQAATFRHNIRASHQRTHSKPVDLSHIQDPLLAQAGCCTNPDPATPITPTESRNSLDLPEGKMRSPSPRPDTPQQLSDSDSDSDYDSLPSSPDPSPATSDEAHLILHTRVYALAEKYDIPSLKQLARGKFEMAMACYYDSPEFAYAIEEVYCSTIDSDRGLRDIVLQAFRNHPRLAQTQDVFTVIRETPSLALELFKIERGIPV